MLGQNGYTTAHLLPLHYMGDGRRLREDAINPTLHELGYMATPH